MKAIKIIIRIISTVIVFIGCFCMLCDGYENQIEDLKAESVVSQEYCFQLHDQMNQYKTLFESYKGKTLDPDALPGQLEKIELNDYRRDCDTSIIEGIVSFDTLSLKKGQFNYYALWSGHYYNTTQTAIERYELIRRFNRTPCVALIRKDRYDNGIIVVL